MPSSAFTPSGFSLNDARKYIHTIAKHKNISYLHLPEGAPSSVKEEKIVGKALAYLVSDFIKQNSSFQK
jgi:formiminoglutamase